MHVHYEDINIGQMYTMPLMALARPAMESKNKIQHNSVCVYTYIRKRGKQTKTYQT